MTTTQDIISVLQAHKREIIKVDLSSNKDCREFWDEFVYAVYYALPYTEIKDETGMLIDHTDSRIKNLLVNFAEVDTLELVNKSGKLLKRFTKFYKENTGTKLDDSTLGIIGDKLQYYLSHSATTYYVDFTDVIDWKDGMFGKGDSCWWGCYSDSRDTFTDNGGWGIRFYDSMEDTQGIGRTWIVPRDGCLLGFNFYGIERPKVSKVIKAVFAQHGITLHYQQAHIYNGQDDCIPYINGHDESNNGFVLYPDDRESSVQDEYDLDMETTQSEKCHHCGHRIDTDYGSYQVLGDEYYCDDCASELLSYCDKCEQYYDRDDVYHVQDSGRYEYLCGYCAKREGLTLCYECKEYSNETVEDSDGDDFCPSCAERHLTFCEHCEEYYYEQAIDNHECVRNRDFSGLVEHTDYVLHAQIQSLRSEDDLHTTTVYKIDGVDGLVLFDTHILDSDMDGWNVCHEASGLAVKSKLTFQQAKNLFVNIAHLTDWNKPANELTSDRELMRTVYAFAEG